MGPAVQNLGHNMASVSASGEGVRKEHRVQALADGVRFEEEILTGHD